MVIYVGRDTVVIYAGSDHGDLCREGPHVVIYVGRVHMW